MSDRVADISTPAVDSHSRDRDGTVDWEAAYKLPSAERYFNVSVLWIAYFPLVLRAFHHLRIRHEVVTLTSLGCGLAAAWFYATAQSYVHLLTAAALFHLKDVTDACDGALARLTSTGHRIGRFLDTIADGIAFGAVVAAVAWREYSVSGETSVWLWAVAALVSLFLQCSYFNYYHLSYVRVLGRDATSRLDERRTVSDRQSDAEGPSRALLAIMQAGYNLWFGWQDRMMAAIDRVSLALAGASAPSDAKRHWYGNRRFLTANSALCFGTQIFAMIVVTVIGQPTWFFPVIVVGFNLYWLAVMIARIVAYRRQHSSSA